MALFGKKKEADCCAICGKERKTGFFRELFQTEVDGQYVCKDCFGTIDIQSEIMKQMTIPRFKEYIAFREANLALKDAFTPTNTIDFGFLDSKIVFDHTHGYLCFSKALDKTIFERKHLKSFVIREDSNVIFEGGANGLTSYGSNVHNQLRLLQMQFSKHRQEARAFEDRLARMSSEEREKNLNNGPRFTATEPFRKFYVELRFDHPYWNTMILDMDGPRFTNNATVEDDYRYAYQSSFYTMEQLAKDLNGFMNH